MTFRRLFVAAAVLALTLPAPAAAHPPDAVSGFTLAVSPSLAAQRPALRREIVAARAEVLAWFRHAGFPLARADVLREAHVYDGASVRAEMARAAGVAVDQIPSGFSGTVLDGALHVVDPAAFRRTWQRLYPREPWTAAAWHQLLVHELAHQAHARVAKARFGSEDAMGPRWFFEGLAIAVADQFPGQPPLAGGAFAALARKDAADVTIGYQTYRRMIDTARRRHGDRALIEQAREAGFSDRIAREAGAR